MSSEICIFEMFLHLTCSDTVLLRTVQFIYIKIIIKKT